MLLDKLPDQSFILSKLDDEREGLPKKKRGIRGRKPNFSIEQELEFKKKATCILGEVATTEEISQFAKSSGLPIPRFLDLPYYNAGHGKRRLNADPNTTIKLSEKLRDSVDWDSISDVTATLNTKFDAPLYRFLKGGIIETVVSLYSNGRIQWVGNDATAGCDLVGEDYRLEQKFIANGIWTPKGTLSSNMKTLPFKNMHGGLERSAMQEVIDRNFTHILLVTNLGAGLLSKDYCRDHADISNDQVIVRYEPSAVVIIVGPKEGINKEEHFKELKERINAAIQDFSTKVKR